MPKPGNNVPLPRLVNRGPAGLLSALPPGAKGRAPVPKPLNGAVSEKEYPKDKIAPDLLSLARPIDSVIFDPVNARLHPEKNIEAVKRSLQLYGQQKPIVVRMATMHVVAGNGTLQCARELGWTKIAASVVDMSEVEAAGYGLADNRTAELAKWDFEVVSRLDKLLQDAGHDQIGWSQDELTVLRTTDWTDVPLEDADAEIEGGEGEPVPEVAPGDAELLMKLKVTIAEPLSQVSRGEVYRIEDRHVLVVADVVHEAELWKQYLADGMLFVPYPDPMMLLTEAAKDRAMLLVQPECYIAGHLLDHYKTVYGAEGVELAASH